jgi:hypothetical protein
MQIAVALADVTVALACAEQLVVAGDEGGAEVGQDGMVLRAE